MINEINNQTVRLPYRGGDPVKCPRCCNIVSNQICNFCGLDLSTVYFKVMEQPPIQPPQPPYDMQFEQPQYTQQPPYGQQYPPYQYQQAARKKNIPLIIAAVFLVLILCTIPIVILTSFLKTTKTQIHQDTIRPPMAQEDYFFAGGVSSEEFKKLKNDMSYAQISAIIGGDGEIINSTETLQGEPSYTYGWLGEHNPNAIVYITITSDKVSDITLEGQL